MKMTRVMAISLMAVFLMASWGIAEEKIPKDQACALIGGCGADMVQVARKMQEECKGMIVEAKKLMEKGKMIRGQGILWQDKEMEADGLAIYEQGKKLNESAKEMHNVCALIIEEGEKTKKKYKSSKKAKDSKEKVMKGDHTPQ